MKFAEHIEVVIGLVDKGATPAQIKAGLLAMLEQAEAHDNTAIKQAELASENAALRAENEKLKNPPPPNINWGPQDPQPDMTT